MELKKRRHEEIRNGSTGAKQSASDWTDGLSLDEDGGVRPILKNLILFMRKHPKWRFEILPLLLALADEVIE